MAFVPMSRNGIQEGGTAQRSGGRSYPGGFTVDKRALPSGLLDFWSAKGQRAGKENFNEKDDFLWGSVSKVTDVSWPEI